MSATEKQTVYPVEGCRLATVRTKCAGAYQSREMNKDHINSPVSTLTDKVPAFEFIQE